MKNKKHKQARRNKEVKIDLRVTSAEKKSYDKAADAITEGNVSLFLRQAAREKAEEIGTK